MNRLRGTKFAAPLFGKLKVTAKDGRCRSNGGEAVDVMRRNAVEWEESEK